MLENVLLYDARGNPIPQRHRVESQDWDQIKDWSRRVYMPYDVSPTGKVGIPASTMRSAQIGRITLTRFAYGIPVRIRDWDMDAGNAVVLTTVGGKASHDTGRGSRIDTGYGESFVADCARTDHDVDFDPDHLQVNLTIPHAVLEQVCLDWLGFVPDDRLWQFRTGIGGRGSSWHALLEYLSRSIAEAPGALERSRVGRHLEQTVCIHLLNEWASRAGLDLEDPANGVAPRVVRNAEAWMVAHAAEAPAITDVARATGCSLRSLNAAFRRFRGYTPSQFLRNERLRAVRQALREAPPHATVAEIAGACGFIHMGEFAKVYGARFGELPSQTLRR